MLLVYNKKPQQHYEYVILPSPHVEQNNYRNFGRCYLGGIITTTNLYCTYKEIN